MSDLPTLAEHERALVEARITLTAGNVQAAARSLGIDRGRMYRLLDRHGLLLETVRHYRKPVAIREGE